MLDPLTFGRQELDQFDVGSHPIGEPLASLLLTSFKHPLGLEAPIGASRSGLPRDRRFAGGAQYGSRGRPDRPGKALRVEPRTASPTYRFLRGARKQLACPRCFRDSGAQSEGNPQDRSGGAKEASRVQQRLGALARPPSALPGAVLLMSTSNGHSRRLHLRSDPRTSADGQRWSTWGEFDIAARGPKPWPDWLITDDGAIDTELGILKTGKEADVFLLERAVVIRGPGSIGGDGRQALPVGRAPALPPRHRLPSRAAGSARAGTGAPLAKGTPGAGRSRPARGPAPSSPS